MAGDGGSQAPMAYNPTGQAQADQNYQTLTNGATNWAAALPGQALPQLTSTVSNVMNNPYAAGAQSTAGQVASLGAGQAGAQLGASAGLGGLATSMSPYLAQLLQTGFDPQSALYNQQQQQNTDQTNAINAMNGVSGTPYGAGLATQSNQNFNTNWQNAQLGRQLSALGGADSALGAIGSGYSTASDLGSTGLTTLQQSGSQPYNTSMGISSDQMAAIQQLIGGTSGALAPSLATSSSLSNYLGLGQGATSINDATTQQNNQQQQSYWSGLSSIGSAALMALAFL